MTVLAPIPDEFPNPDCEKCGGEGVPQSFAHRVLADDYSNKACPECWRDEDQNVTSTAWKCPINWPGCTKNCGDYGCGN